MSHRYLVLVAGLWVMGCSDPAGPADALGDWGGEGAAMIALADQVTFEFDCAHGTVAGLLSLDGNGAFEVSGLWVPEGGPIPDPPPEGLPAVFRGRVSGDNLTLEVDILPREVTAGPYQLRRDRSPFLRKCL